jgi:hypothetical protein
LDINQEREFGYEGYQGMLELVKQLTLTIESPVWQAVRAPAPWKNVNLPGFKNLEGLNQEADSTSKCNSFLVIEERSTVIVRPLSIRPKMDKQ